MSSSAVANCLEDSVAPPPPLDIHDPDKVLNRIALALAREIGRQAARAATEGEQSAGGRYDGGDDDEGRVLRALQLRRAE
jgi:hypothetical protein